MKNKVRKRKTDFERASKRYAKRVISDIKDNLLFGEELWTFIVASAKHDLSGIYNCEEMYMEIEEAILNIYDKDVHQCVCCKRYRHKDYIIKSGGKKYCTRCYSGRNNK